MRLLKTIAILLAIVIVFGAAMFALNLHTGPIIEANKAGAANDRLNAVMPGATGYEDITSTLEGLPASVVKVSKELSGLGYVVEATASSQFTGGVPMDIVLGVSADGKICGLELAGHSESAIFGGNDPKNYTDTYIGKDSALADVGLWAGSTFSSTAFKTAVSEALEALIANGLITAGVKSDAQILEELIPTLAPGFGKTAEVEATGNAVKALKAENGTGYAIIFEGKLALVNAMGVCKVYDTEGAEVTEGSEELVSEALGIAAGAVGAYDTALTDKIGRAFDGATDVKMLASDSFNTVVSAASFTLGDTVYYGFYSRSVGFHQMDVFVFIDQLGAIAKLDAKQFIFEEEYFMAFGGMDTGAYKEGFVGLTDETFTGEQAMIATATMTSNAVSQSVSDAFEAFAFVAEEAIVNEE